MLRRKQKVTNMHYYYVEIFLVATDAILTELNHRFSETSLELLVCTDAFNPRNSSNFDVDKLVRFAQIYALLFCQINLKASSTVLEELKNFLDALNLEKLLKLWSRLI